MTEQKLDIHNKTNKQKYEVIRYIIMLLIILLLLRVLFWPVRVDGHSMESTLMNHDFVILSKVPTINHNYDYDDIVVVVVLDEQDQKERVVKRIIGKPGDHVVIKDDQLYINGEKKDEPYRNGAMLYDLDYYVPGASYFILGDNRSISRDSRIFGCVEGSQIKDVVILKLF